MQPETSTTPIPEPSKDNESRHDEIRRQEYTHILTASLRRLPPDLRDDVKQEAALRYIRFDRIRAPREWSHRVFAKRCVQSAVETVLMKAAGYSKVNRHLVCWQEPLVEEIMYKYLADPAPTPEDVLIAEETKEKGLPRWKKLRRVENRLRRTDPIAWRLLDDLLSGRRSQTLLALTIGHANLGLRGKRNSIARHLAGEFRVSPEAAKAALYPIREPSNQYTKQHKAA
jgi:hypothetical protein